MNQAKQGSAFLSVSRPVGSGFHFSSDFCDTEQIQLQVFALRTSGARKSCATTRIDIRVPISVSRSNAIRRLSLRFALRDSHWSRLCSPATTRRSTIPLLQPPDRMKLSSSKPRSDCNKSRSMSCANVSTHSKTFYKEYTPLAR